ncbi:AraC family transcriptional regulator [Chondromyces crocatus]|uniref:AraC family transcriptional regulator n=1 Tax=Chondromyces crocatus TaxID=52 RepID=A0A0K1ER05_CHOCO|nr:AraC family transcriptional regulator [Chondromyces crocatus]AKT43067.1 AraC family transcriptional regulator [Chondromyces crocatus]
MALDPLSDVLSLLRPRGYVSAGLNAGGDWALRFPGHEGIKFNAVTRGACWLFVDGDEAPVRIEEGDGFLLTKGRPFTLATDLSLPPIDARGIYAEAKDGIATWKGGGDVFLIGSRFVFADRHADLLFGTLPPVVHVRETSDNASVLRWAIHQITAELRRQQPGGQLVAEHLAHIMLVQVLRLHLTSHAQTSPGWLSALTDRQLSVAVSAMHAEPASRWTVEELARRAGMSRSTFALKFKQVVGTSPLDYLTRWRMLVAGDRLRNSDETIAVIATSLGYDSESAFSTAFKRVMACSPRQYQRAPHPG